MFQLVLILIISEYIIFTRRIVHITNFEPLVLWDSQNPNNHAILYYFYQRFWTKFFFLILKKRYFNKKHDEGLNYILRAVRGCNQAEKWKPPRYTSMALIKFVYQISIRCLNFEEKHWETALIQGQKGAKISYLPSQLTQEVDFWICFTTLFRSLSTSSPKFVCNWILIRG